MKVYEIAVVMKFHGQIEAESQEDAEKQIAALGPEAVWDGDDWLLEAYTRHITANYDASEGEEGDDDEPVLA